MLENEIVEELTALDGLKIFIMGKLWIVGELCRDSLSRFTQHTSQECKS